MGRERKQERHHPGRLGAMALRAAGLRATGDRLWPAAVLRAIGARPWPAALLPAVVLLATSPGPSSAAAPTADGLLAASPRPSPASAVQSAPGTGTDPLPLTRLEGPVVVDGIPDEAAWQDVPPLPLTMYFPTFGGEPEQRTEIRVAYDDGYLYAAGWFWDDKPEDIRVNSLYRDRWNGDDAFALYIDAFNDNRNARWFGTTPGGIRFDHLVSDDGATTNASWDAFWEARTTVDGRGWFAEVRIPFSTLGFQADAAGRAVMGLTVTRLVARTGERVTFPAIDPAFQFRQPSVARDVVLRDVTTSTPLYVTPYVLMGRDRVTSAGGGTSGGAGDGRTGDGSDGGVDTRTDPSREVGLDLRYPLSSTLTLDVTVNTDFAQVEADDQQVNLDRFPLFFPEKRRFFQERSGLFDFATGGGSRLFHSRRIGLTPERTPVPVLGGARLVGRIGPWDVGLLDMQTDALGDLPSENFGVVRLKRQVLNPNSFVGLMATSRAGDGAHNLALGADGSFRVFGDDYLTLKWAGTHHDADPADADVGSRSHLNLHWQRRVSRGLAYTLEVVRSGADFRPDGGFLPRRDFTTANLLANWYRFTEDHPVYRRVWPGMLAFSTFRNGDGALESGQYAVWVQWETRAGGSGWIEPKVFHEDVAAPFTVGGEAVIPAGRYTFADLQIFYRMPVGERLRTGVDFRSGTFFDGTRTQVVVTPTWNVSPHLELGADYQLTRLRFAERDEAADIHVARFRVRTALDARASGNAFVQYESASDRLGVNLRLRYAFSEGNDLWVVWDEGLAVERRPDPTGPRLPRSVARTLILKYSHTFGF